MNQTIKKQRVLLFTDWFLPGFKGGGPIQTIAGMIDNLSDDIDFYVVTRDRDLGSTLPYPNIESEVWNKFGGAKIYYWPPTLRAKLKILNSLKNINYDIIYLNGVFSFASSVFPLFCIWIGMVKRAQMVIAPRGELSEAALGLKPLKKRMYLAAAKYIGLHAGVLWHASSDFEKDEILVNFGDSLRGIVVAPNLSPKYIVKNGRLHEKMPDRLKLVTLSRISRKKNIHYTLKLLTKVKGEVQYYVYGPREDKEYWAECLALIRNLPNNVSVHYMGEIPHENVDKVLSQYDYFIFPTLGENYGHVIREAMMAGLPVIISNKTPWRDLENKSVGWDLPLEKSEAFVEIIDRCIQINDAEYQKSSKKAKKYSIEMSNHPSSISANRNLFLRNN